MQNPLSQQHVVSLQHTLGVLRESLSSLERVLLDHATHTWLRERSGPLSVIDLAGYDDVQLAVFLLKLAQANADVLDYLDETQTRDGALVFERLQQMHCGLAALLSIADGGTDETGKGDISVCGSL